MAQCLNKGHYATRYGSGPAVVSVICLLEYMQVASGICWHSALHFISVSVAMMLLNIYCQCAGRDGHIKAWGKKVKNNKNTILYRCCKKANNNGAVMNEVRQNKATKEWVIYATSR